MRSNRVGPSVALLSISCGASVSLAQACVPEWRGYALNGPVLSLYSDVAADGGPELYVGGAFTAPPHIARFTGDGFVPVAGGLDGDVLSITRHNDGSGSTIYACGFFRVSSGGPAELTIGRIVGGAFAAVGSGQMGPNSWTGYVGSVSLSNGPRLVTSGGFAFPCSYVTQWNGSSWECLGGGLGSAIHDGAMYNDGTGNALFCVGSLIVNNAPFSEAIGIGRWNGSAWSTVGGIAGGSPEACIVFDDGSGPELVVAGRFFRAGSSPAVSVSNIAKWNGHRWAALGAGTNNTVRALAVFDDGSGPKLYAGGDFTQAGGAPANRLARWDGHAWTACPAGGIPAGSVHRLATHDPDGAGPLRARLFVGGSFMIAGAANTPASNFAVLLPTTSPGDFNADGFVDFTDVDAFVLAFEGGSDSADFNTDGFLDFTDFDAFVAAFEHGC